MNKLQKNLWLFTLKPVGRLLAKYVLNRPEWEYLFATRYPTARLFFTDAINQGMYFLNQPRSLPLRNLTFEVSNICNLKCIHCPTSDKMTREKKLLDSELFKKVIDDNPQLDRIILMNWGEPLLHPNIIKMIRYAHERNIETHLTTNGTLLSDEVINKLLKSGLERIAFSMDGLDDTYNKVRGFDYKKLEKNILKLLDTKSQLGTNMQVELSVTIFEETEKDIQNLVEKWKDKVDFIKIRPKEIIAGNERATKCRELWRSGVVLSNGKVIPCTVDYDGLLAIGDATKERIVDIFNSKKMVELRLKHIQGSLPMPCKQCAEYQNELVKPRFFG